MFSGSIFILREYGVRKPSGGRPGISGITGPDGSTGGAPNGPTPTSGNPIFPGRGDRPSFMLSDRDTPAPGVRDPAAADPYGFAPAKPGLGEGARCIGAALEVEYER